MILAGGEIMGLFVKSADLQPLSVSSPRFSIGHFDIQFGTSARSVDEHELNRYS
jgi:hypothetical protein